MTPITRVGVSVFTIPTDGPESDGTLEWTSTTIVIVETAAGGTAGLGYTYGHKATATLIADMLVPIVRDRDAMDVAGAWIAMTRAIRKMRTTCRSRRTLPLLFTCIRAAPSGASGISNTSTIMSASSACCSTGPWNPSTGCYGRIYRGPAWDSS